MMLNCLYVGIGGFIGSIMRYLFSLMPFFERMTFPAATLTVNALGGLIIGVFYALTGHYAGLNGGWTLFVQIGICGGFTTFSAFSLESIKFLESGRVGIMLIYILASVVICLCTVWLGKTGMDYLLK